MNEKYTIVQIPMFKCNTCGKNVPEDCIILSNERTFDCPHCNKSATPKTQKHYEEKTIEVYTTPKGVVIKNPSSYYGVKHRHEETIAVEIC